MIHQISKIVILAIMISSISYYSLQAQEKAGPEMDFEVKEHDFGDIEQGDKVEYTFEFTNVGNQPLIIQNVLTTCGCTAPEWPRDPVKSGESASIKIKFNSAGKSGIQNKIIRIMSNAGQSPEILKIKANVLVNADKS